MSTGLEGGRRASLHLQPCKHQVAGHLFEEGKAGSLVDDIGHFYKPLQAGPRGQRELEFYETVRDAVRADNGLEDAHPAGSLSDEDEPEPSVSGRDSEYQRARESLPFGVRNAVLLRCIPRFYGTIKMEGRLLLELEDVAKRYKHPSIIDIKVGFRTWYQCGDQRYIDKCKLKDAATTQSSLGFKICGMQVYRHFQRGYWRASKRWCKQMSGDAVSKALLRFANNEKGLTAEDVYGGPKGAIQQLDQLGAWFLAQREYYFYSSSVLIIYEGDAHTAEEARVSIRLVDFAHTFAAGGKQDTNFIQGMTALIMALNDVLGMEDTDSAL